MNDLEVAIVNLREDSVNLRTELTRVHKNYTELHNATRALIRGLLNLELDDEEYKLGVSIPNWRSLIPVRLK